MFAQAPTSLSSIDHWSSSAIGYVGQVYQDYALSHDAGGILTLAYYSQGTW